MICRPRCTELSLSNRTTSWKRVWNSEPLAGIVLHVPNRSLSPDSSDVSSSPFNINTGASRFLLLKTDAGVIYVAHDDVAALEVTGDPIPRTVQRKQPVLLLVSRDGGEQKICHVSYLTHGISWAPDYHVNLQSTDRLTIEQHAAIRNELTDLQDAEISVISGFPNVQFSQVLSPIAPSQTWQQFFQQIGRRPGEMTFSSSILMQNSLMQNGASVRDRDVASFDASAPDPGDAVDLSYVSIGRRSLAKGDALLTSTGRAETAYERIVEWSIPDNRDEWGNPNSSRQVDPATGDALPDDVWDAIRFRNPLPFPMTGAPVMITSQGRFHGQSQTLWTNTGDEATIRVSKALSIRAVHVEYENQTDDPGLSERDLVTIGGRRFRKVTVNGELRLGNHRSVDARLVVTRKFSGDFVSADASPKIDLREEGVWTVNRRNELTWLISLKPQEERLVKYQYTVLVSF
jgi:hypothetical protein